MLLNSTDLSLFIDKISGQAAPGALPGSGMPAAIPAEGLADQPWYRVVTRWGQVNITEKDPPRYDIPWWRGYWKRTETKGIVVNAGGIVAYYPTRIPLHRRAEYLQGGDLFGDLCRAAREDGLAVFARMDSNRAHGEFFQAHPDWFAVDAAGKPYRADDLYITCINGPYYSEHIPSILEEIIRLYHPEGFTDNSWSGLGRGSICYCEHCRKSFYDYSSYKLPVVKNWDDRAYREWIRWSYSRRLAIWDLNNRVVQAAGGRHCVWSGMNSGSISGQCHSFRDFKAIGERAEIIMLDDQARSDNTGFQHNGENGKLIHGLLGWDKLIPESMAQYQAHDPWFRLASKPEPEARMWMIEGIAGGIQPWWHMVGAYHEDRRMYHNPEKIFRWHKDHESLLLNRFPVATIGVVWSQQNMDFYGRDEMDERVELPWRGMVQALIRGRIPWLPVHADHISRDAARFKLLILPNLCVLTDGQAAAIRQFVESGGGLLATGESSLYDEWGDRRSDYALADLIGAHVLPETGAAGAGGQGDTTAAGQQKPAEKLAGDVWHTYLRLEPGMRAMVDGPHKEPEPAVSGKRHAVLKGFEETDTIPFGGLLKPLGVGPGVQVLMTYIPQFPVYPPEKAWMRTPKTEVPGLLLKEAAGRGRVAFLPADLDRQFGRSNLPDHGNLLGNIIRWAVGEPLPLLLEGPGMIDCHLYRQEGELAEAGGKDPEGKGSRLILHLVNLTSAASWRQPLDELIPVGPLKVRVKLPAGVDGTRLRRLVSPGEMVAGITAGWCRFVIPSVTDHEVVVIG